LPVDGLSLFEERYRDVCLNSSNIVGFSSRITNQKKFRNRNLNTLKYPDALDVTQLKTKINKDIFRHVY